MLDALPHAGTEALRTQLTTARVVGGVPTLLDLDVDPATPRATYPDGPLPVEATVTGPGSAVIGGILVWIKSGYLDGLEYFWYTDDPPTEWPSPDQLTTEPR